MLDESETLLGTLDGSELSDVESSLLHDMISLLDDDSSLFDENVSTSLLELMDSSSLLDGG
jgi:hypothetical protein